MKKLLLVLTSLSLLVACAEGPAPVSPRDAVLDAISAVYEAGTVHEEVKMSMSADGESFTFSAEADVDNENQRMGMTMDLGMLGGTMEVVVDKGVFYMRSPTFQDVGTDWISVDPTKLDPAKAAQLGGFGAGTMDPSAFVGLFAGVFDVKAAGEQEIDGVTTKHYVGTIDLKKVLEGFSDVVGEEVDAVTREQLEMALEQFEALGIDETLPFEIWIDAEGLPRRQRVTMDFGDLVPGAEDARMEMTVDLSGFGEPVDIEVPDPADVTDMTETMAGAGAGVGGGAGSGAYG
jgi:hypothetical protein